MLQVLGFSMTALDKGDKGELSLLATAALPLWGISDAAELRLINLSENATFLVTAPDGCKTILRVHRPGYHSHRAIECELAWMKALTADGGVPTPAPIPGRNGKLIQRLALTGMPERHSVLFEFLEGVEPDPDSDLIDPFHQLGAIAARTHIHSIGWSRPLSFERLVWDDDMVFGRSPTWGQWQDGPGVDAASFDVLSRAEGLCRRRLAKYGQDSDRFGLIHADMRLANLLIDKGVTRLIDFDDCGLGWFMYDFAAAISFMETHPVVPQLRAAWLDGYRSVRPISAEDEFEIDSLVMMRRLALLAWIGSHSETDLAKEQAPHFAIGSVDLAHRFLASHG